MYNKITGWKFVSFKTSYMCAYSFSMLSQTFHQIKPFAFKTVLIVCAFVYPVRETFNTDQFFKKKSEKWTY